MDRTATGGEEGQAQESAAKAALGAFYFGCGAGVWHRDVGHGYYLPGGKTFYPRRSEVANGDYGIGPFPKVDGQLAPVDYFGRLVFKADDRRAGERGEEYPQGVAALHHRGGWTALAFWDRTGDSRGNSNSNFFFDAVLDFDEALTAAREHFPELFERFDFEVVAAKRPRGAKAPSNPNPESGAGEGAL